MIQANTVLMVIIREALGIIKFGSIFSKLSCIDSLFCCAISMIDYTDNDCIQTSKANARKWKWNIFLLPFNIPSAIIQYVYFHYFCS